MDLTMTAIALVGAHSFLDFAGQGDFMSKAKNASSPIPGVPWATVLASHAVQHGAAVALITGVWWLFFVETAIHALTDDAKCRNYMGFNTDQAIHLLCKAGYVLLLFAQPELSAWAA